jgi:hypothetical protein
MNGYIVMYQGKQRELWAPTLYHAKKMAVQYFRPKKKDEHLISVILCEKDGKEVTHSTSEV